MSGGLDELRRAVGGPDGDPRIGRVIGKFVVEARLGAGGMGEVYRARHRETDAPVALKVLAPRASGTISAGRNAERFQRGVRAAAQLGHPGIVTVLDAGCEDGLWYMAMRLVDGPSLAELLASRGRFAAGEARGVILQIADALAHVHRHGVVHRDVKPGNVLFDRADERYLLSDFDLVRPLVDAGDAGSLTREGAAVGTAAYMAPEQIAGQPVDAGVDAWALGAVWFELLTGAPPFGHGNFLELARRVCAEGPPPDPRDRGVELPDGDARLLGSLLARDRTDRPALPSVTAALAGAKAAASDARGGAARRPRASARRPVTPAVPASTDGASGTRSPLVVVAVAAVGLVGLLTLAVLAGLSGVAPAPGESMGGSSGPLAAASPVRPEAPVSGSGDRGGATTSRPGEGSRPSPPSPPLPPSPSPPPAPDPGFPDPTDPPVAPAIRASLADLLEQNNPAAALAVIRDAAPGLGPRALRELERLEDAIVTSLEQRLTSVSTDDQLATALAIVDLAYRSSRPRAQQRLRAAIVAIIEARYREDYARALARECGPLLRAGRIDEVATAVKRAERAPTSAPDLDRLEIVRGAYTLGPRGDVTAFWREAIAVVQTIGETFAARPDPAGLLPGTGRPEWCWLRRADPADDRVVDVPLEGLSVDEVATLFEIDPAVPRWASRIGVALVVFGRVEEGTRLLARSEEAGHPLTWREAVAGLEERERRKTRTVPTRASLEAAAREMDEHLARGELRAMLGAYRAAGVDVSAPGGEELLTSLRVWAAPMLRLGAALVAALAGDPERVEALARAGFPRVFGPEQVGAIADVGTAIRSTLDGDPRLLAVALDRVGRARFLERLVGEELYGALGMLARVRSLAWRFLAPMWTETEFWVGQTKVARELVEDRTRLDESLTDLAASSTAEGALIAAMRASLTASTEPTDTFLECFWKDDGIAVPLDLTSPMLALALNPRPVGDWSFEEEGLGFSGGESYGELLVPRLDVWQKIDLELTALAVPGVVIDVIRGEDDRSVGSVVIGRDAIRVGGPRIAEDIRWRRREPRGAGKSRDVAIRLDLRAGDLVIVPVYAGDSAEGRNVGLAEGLSLRIRTGRGTVLRRIVLHRRKD